MRLLLVEDKETFRRLLVQALTGSAWDILAVGDGQEGVEALERSAFDVLVTDLRLPGMNGIQLIQRAKRMHPSMRVVLMSAFGEPRDIVEAMRCGADDFLPKPFDLDVFAATLERLAALTETPPPDPREPWIACSPALQALDRALVRAAEGASPVLFCGEPGVGKSRAARRLHTLRNPQGPFWATEAAALSDTRNLARMAEGSIYLRDLETLAVDSLKHLRDVMDSEAGRQVRWMGGIRSLEEIPEALRLRLGVLSFGLPPLRDRKEDVLPLFRSFVEAGARREGRPVPVVERLVERDLLKRNWPGNAREVAWCAAHALRATSGSILVMPPEGVASQDMLCLPVPKPGSLESMLSEVGRQAEGVLLRRALEAHGRNPAETAAALGLTTRSMAQRLRDHQIPLEEA